MNVTVDNPKRTRWTTYIVLGIIFILLAGGALLAYSSAKESRQAEEKADQLISELNAAGLRAPSRDQIENVLGDDGGAICDDPNNALKRGVLHGMLTNGAGGPGVRPVIADNKVVQGQLLVIKVYCPDEAEEFAEFADNLKVADVASG
jgi:Tfp pilus assembly protein FimT